MTETGVESELDRVGRCWDEATLRRDAQSLMGWLDHPYVLEEYVFPRISPQGKRGNWVADLAHEMDLDPNGRWLSLGCGSGDQEVLCRELGLCRRLDAFDISPLSISSATQKAVDKELDALHFEVADLHDLDLGIERYDAVLMGMSLHHVERLNGLLARIHASLKPDGYLLINEYIGPAQFQFSNRQLTVVAQLLAGLPESKRFDHVEKRTKTAYERRSREFWFTADPSESITSDAIEGALQRFFEVVVRRPYGGPVLHLLLEHIVANFDPADEADQRLLGELMQAEQALIGDGTLRDQFAVFVARSKPTSKLRFAWWFDALVRLRTLSWRGAVWLRSRLRALALRGFTVLRNRMRRFRSP